MAKKQKKNKHSESEKSAWHKHLPQETKHSLWALFSFVIAILLGLAYFGKAGAVGNALQYTLELLFGKAFFIVPAVFLLAGIAFIKASERPVVASTLIGACLLLLSLLGLFDVLGGGSHQAGYIGFFAAYPLFKFFDFWASIVIFSALGIASLLIMLSASFLWRKKEDADDDVVQPLVTVPTQEMATSQSKVPSGSMSNKDDEVEVASLSQESKGFFGNVRRPQKPIPAPRISVPYTPPPLDFLEDNKGTPSSGDIKANANVIKRTLANFGIDVEMAEVHIGPSVTQYTLKPAEGIKLSRVTALHNDLALALAAHPLRIEAPIPGKSLVGIEVPNRSIALVGLHSILQLEEFQKSPSLTFALGRDVAGQAVFADIARMPHLLIAGATGSGKSIAIHTLLVSLLYKNSPQLLRFIMIDPKRVELATYNSIAHLLAPVIVDAKKAVIALRWAVREMERRYEKLSAIAARDINSYNAIVLKDGKEEDLLPYLVIIIDELANLMGTYPREIEASIVRLAQMSRAVGIHLVVSTQRPSVEVITGLIKANITARIALQVASQVDSRTILDMSGAEKLLGNGDMLYLAGDTSKPRRIQGAFISEREVKRVASHIAEMSQNAPASALQLEMVPDGMDNPFESVDVDGETEDELYEEAKQVVIETQKASTSYLQRRLRIGYARAARLMDILEERGVVGPGEGAKPREVLIKKGEGKSEQNELQTIDTTEFSDEYDEEEINLRNTPYTNFDEER